jgi:O-antigen/teichoic acid export membrane protein
MKDAPVEITGIGHVYRRFARNSAYLFGGTVASAVFTMGAVAASARSLGQREFGILILLQTATLMIGALSSVVSQQPVIKLGSAAKEAEDKTRLGRVISMGLIADLTASTVAFIVALLLIFLFADEAGLTGKYRESAFIFAATLPFSYYPSSNGIFRLFDRFGRLSLIQAGSAAALMVAAGTLYYIRAPFEAFVWAWALYVAGNGQLQLWLSLALVGKKRIPLRLSPRIFSGQDSKVFLQYCWSTWAMASLETVRSNGDSLLVGALVSVEAAGLYNVAKQLSGVLRKFNVVYTAALFPEVSMLAAQDRLASAKKLKRQLVRLGVLASIVAVAGAALIGHPVLRLVFGNAFEEAYIPLVILTVAAAVHLFSQTHSIYVQVYVGPTALLRAYVVAVFTFAITALPLTFAFSIIGTAFAQVAFGVIFIVMCHLALHRAGNWGPAGALAR